MDEERREFQNSHERQRRGILVLDMSYTLKMFDQRQLGQALDSRRLEGYFAQVISVHPLAGLFEAAHRRIGRPLVTRIDASHVFVEGKQGRTRWLRLLPPLNFAVAQFDLIRRLLDMSRATEISVIRVGDPYYLGLIGWVLAKQLHVPLAIRVPFRFDEIRRITGRAVMPRLLRWGWVEKCIERFIFKRCDLIAGANEDNMRYALENGGRVEVATVFRYGNLLHPSHWVDPQDRPDPGPDLERLGLGRSPFVATVARLEPMKRVEDAILAVGELVRRGCDVRGLIIGDGSSRNRLTDYVRSLGLEQFIVFAGNQPQEWIARVLPRASVIVSPHMGRALAEAALSGVPIVAYDYDWQREVVADGETGYLVGNGEWLKLAECTERLLADPGRARILGENARVKVSRMMDPNTLIRHEQAVYTELLKEWASGWRRISKPETAT